MTPYMFFFLHLEEKKTWLLYLLQEAVFFYLPLISLIVLL
jgi:hypothetical protein